MSLRNLIESLFELIRVKLLNKIPKEIDNLLDEVMPVMAEIKKWLDSKEAIALTAAIPGIKDDLIRIGGSNIIGNILSWYGYEDIDQWGEDTKNKAWPDQHARLQKLPSLIVKEKLDIKESISDTFTQIHYTGKQK